MINLALPKRTVKYDLPETHLHIEAVFATANATASMVRTRINNEALQQLQGKDDVTWENGAMQVYLFPDFIAALTHFAISGLDEMGEPFSFDADLNDQLPFELYRQLPESFLVECETAIYELNPQWSSKAEDPKVSSTASASTA